MIYVHKQSIGNSAAISRMLNKLATPNSSCAQILYSNDISGIIIPGNGSFDGFMADLRSRRDDLSQILYLVRNKNIPLLGVCVGMQALFQKSDEGVEPGLGLLKGNIKLFPDNSLIPNLGWRDTKHSSKTGEYFLPADRYYFSHSYAYMLDDYDQTYDEVLYCEHKNKFCAAIKKQNIFGAQFHPEKSSLPGLEFISKYLEFCRNG